MIHHVRFNIRNRWQNVFLKIGGKHRRIFNKMSEIKTINFYCCTTIFDTSNLNTHFYLVFWLLPYQWYFCIKAELRRSWLNFVVVQPPAGKARLLQNHSNCCKLLFIQSLNSTVRMLCQFCMAWPWGVHVKRGPLPLHQLLIYPDSVGTKSPLEACLFYFVLSPKQWCYWKVKMFRTSPSFPHSC